MTPEPVPGWQKWLLPEVPGLRQFAIGAVAMLMPLPAVLFGPEQVIPAMAVGITLGVGFGLGWAVLYARQWLSRAPISAIGVFAITFGCLLHVMVMPRWELLLRLQDAREQLAYYQDEREAGVAGAPPRYQRGNDEQRFAIVPGASGRAIAAYTPLPLRRWSPFGWRDNCWLLLHADGEVETVWNAADLAKAMPALAPRAPDEITPSTIPEAVEAVTPPAPETTAATPPAPEPTAATPLPDPPTAP